MALNKNATDGVINGWKNSHKSKQDEWRLDHPGYFQVLRDRSKKPTDQPDDVDHLLPNNPNVDARIDVYESPDGKGWVATFYATDAGNDWFRTVSSHEGGAISESNWAQLPSGQVFP